MQLTLISHPDESAITVPANGTVCIVVKPSSGTKVEAILRSLDKGGLEEQELRKCSICQELADSQFAIIVTCPQKGSFSLSIMQGTKVVVCMHTYLLHHIEDSIPIKYPTLFSYISFY